MIGSENGYIGIESSDCCTALGDARETSQALVEGKIALKPTPVLGEDGGDLVPIAATGELDETLPPRWIGLLDGLRDQIPDNPWGTAKYPVFLTSSNYDVGSLYAYRKNGDTRFLKIGTPANCLSYLKKRYGWGENAIALSHACVTSHLGVEMATRYLRSGLADKALVFSFDYVSPFVAGGFHSLKILNEGFPAPYQERETGSIGLGDGAAFVVLSRDETNVRLESNFLYNEMYHFTSNDPDGSGFRESAEWAQKVSKGRRIWVKGHGTGTLDSAKLEAEAFNSVLPESPLVSWKGSLGHTLGSCGAVELAVTVASIESGRAAGTVGSRSPTMTENVSLDCVDTGNFEGVALFSNAFGGAHAGCFISYD